MPYKPGHNCAVYGCPGIAKPGRQYCEKHAAMEPPKDAYDPDRSAYRRGYGKKWEAARKRYLASHPLCVECQKEGRYVQATDVDHIIPHRGDMALFWDEGNWQALCHSCHSIKTNREDRYFEYRYSNTTK